MSVSETPHLVVEDRGVDFAESCWNWRGDSAERLFNRRGPVRVLAA